MVESSTQDIFEVTVVGASLASSYQKEIDCWWTTERAIDELYIEMCEAKKVQVDDPRNSYDKKISKYYIKAAKYSGRISWGDFEDDENGNENQRHKPVFEINPNDFSPCLQAELKSLLNTSPDTLRRVVQNAVFRIFRARHKMIFYQYIENDGLNWRFTGE